MTHDPDARILSGPALAHVRSALMMARDAFPPGAVVLKAEMQAALDSLDSGQSIEDDEPEPHRSPEERVRILATYRKVGILPTDEYADGDIEPPKPVIEIGDMKVYQDGTMIFGKDPPRSSMAGRHAEYHRRLREGGDD